MLGGRKPSCPQPFAEIVLEVALDALEADAPLGEDRPEFRDAAAPRMAFDQVGQRGAEGEAQVRRLVQRPPQPPLVEHRCEVEEGARGPGDRDPVADHDLVGGKLGAVDDQAGPRRDSSWNGELRQSAPRAQRQVRECASMAQDGVITEGEDCGEPTTLLRQRRVAQAIDAVVNSQQPALMNPATDPGGREAEREQLTPGRDPVLAPRKPADGILVGSLSKY